MTRLIAPPNVTSQSEQIREPFLLEKDLQPSRYIVKGSTDGPGLVESCPPFSPIPVINLSLIARPFSSKERENELEKLRLSLTTCGFFQVLFHYSLLYDLGEKCPM